MAVTVPVALGVTETRVPTDPNFGRDASGNPLAVPGMVERIARKGLVFARSSDGTSFTNSKYPRFVIRPQWVPVLPVSNGPDAHPGAGKPGFGGLPLTQVQGFRWTDRSGAWIEYDSFGRISSYGDRNDQRVWMQYSPVHHRLERVLDANGRTVFTLLYTGNGNFITEARDHTAPNGIRSVKYGYDGEGRLSSVTDARNNVTTFGYGSPGGGAVNPQPNTFYNIKKVTDAEGRITQVTYGSTGRMDAIIAPDQGVTNFEYGYDKLTKEFSVTVKYPQTTAGRRIETRRYDA
jgi:YD repeat-containing protein